MNENTATRRSSSSRSAGERAFDRCFYPFGVILALTLIGSFLELISRHTTANGPRSEAEIAAVVPGLAWFTWLPFTLGVLLCIYCLWALWSVLRAWRDPRARVLRFSAMALLLFDAGIACSFLISPWD